jgi:hypothetical protein
MCVLCVAESTAITPSAPAVKALPTGTLKAFTVVAALMSNVMPAAPAFAESFLTTFDAEGVMNAIQFFALAGSTFTLTLL